MTLVAVHQPNYAPWLGFFAKVAAADAFVLLDDAQFSKNGYINRVQVLGGDGAARWLTVPVTVSLGDPICAVRPARGDWARAHRDTLRGAYAEAAAFREAWPEVERIYAGLPGGDLATVNGALIRALAGALGLESRFVAASELGAADLAGDDRLVALVRAVDPAGAYLSGRGGAKYQDPDKFAAAGLGFRYTGFEHPEYDQGGGDFVPGLSVLDAVFHLGWDGAAALVADGAA